MKHRGFFKDNITLYDSCIISRIHVSKIGVCRFFFFASQMHSKSSDLGFKITNLDFDSRPWRVIRAAT